MGLRLSFLETSSLQHGYQSLFADGKYLAHSISADAPLSYILDENSHALAINSDRDPHWVDTDSSPLRVFPEKLYNTLVVPISGQNNDKVAVAVQSRVNGTGAMAIRLSSQEVILVDQYEDQCIYYINTTVITSSLNGGSEVYCRAPHVSRLASRLEGNFSALYTNPLHMTVVDLFGDTSDLPEWLARRITGSELLVDSQAPLLPLLHVDTDSVTAVFISPLATALKSAMSAPWMNPHSSHLESVSLSLVDKQSMASFIPNIEIRATDSGEWSSEYTVAPGMVKQAASAVFEATSAFRAGHFVGTDSLTAHSSIPIEETFYSSGLSASAPRFTTSEIVLPPTLPHINLTVNDLFRPLELTRHTARPYARYGFSTLRASVVSLADLLPQFLFESPELSGLSRTSLDNLPLVALVTVSDRAVEDMAGFARLWPITLGIAALIMLFIASILVFMVHTAHPIRIMVSLVETVADFEFFDQNELDDALYSSIYSAKPPEVTHLPASDLDTPPEESVNRIYEPTHWEKIDTSGTLFLGHYCRNFFHDPTTSPFQQQYTYLAGTLPPPLELLRGRTGIGSDEAAILSNCAAQSPAREPTVFSLLQRAMDPERPDFYYVCPLCKCSLELRELAGLQTVLSVQEQNEVSNFKRWKNGLNLNITTFVRCPHCSRVCLPQPQESLPYYQIRLPDSPALTGPSFSSSSSHLSHQDQSDEMDSSSLSHSSFAVTQFHPRSSISGLGTLSNASFVWPGVKCKPLAMDDSEKTIQEDIVAPVIQYSSNVFPRSPLPLPFLRVISSMFSQNPGSGLRIDAITMSHNPGSLVTVTTRPVAEDAHLLHTLLGKATGSDFGISAAGPTGVILRSYITTVAASGVTDVLQPPLTIRPPSSPQAPSCPRAQRAPTQGSLHQSPIILPQLDNKTFSLKQNMATLFIGIQSELLPFHNLYFTELGTERCDLPAGRIHTESSEHEECRPFGSLLQRYTHSHDELLRQVSYRPVHYHVSQRRMRDVSSGLTLSALLADSQSGDRDQLLVSARWCSVTAGVPAWYTRARSYMDVTGPGTLNSRELVPDRPMQRTRNRSSSCPPLPSYNRRSSLLEDPEAGVRENHVTLSLDQYMCASAPYLPSALRRKPFSHERVYDDDLVSEPEAGVLQDKIPIVHSRGSNDSATLNEVLQDIRTMVVACVGDGQEGTSSRAHMDSGLFPMPGSRNTHPVHVGGASAQRLLNSLSYIRNLLEPYMKGNEQLLLPRVLVKDMPRWVLLDTISNGLLSDSIMFMPHDENLLLGMQLLSDHSHMLGRLEALALLDYQWVHDVLRTIDKGTTIINGSNFQTSLSYVQQMVGGSMSFENGINDIDQPTPIHNNALMRPQQVGPYTSGAMSSALAAIHSDHAAFSRYSSLDQATVTLKSGQLQKLSMRLPRHNCNVGVFGHNEYEVLKFMLSMLRARYLAMLSSPLLSTPLIPSDISSLVDNMSSVSAVTRIAAEQAINVARLIGNYSQPIIPAPFANGGDRYTSTNISLNCGTNGDKVAPDVAQLGLSTLLHSKGFTHREAVWSQAETPHYLALRKLLYRHLLRMEETQGLVVLLEFVLSSSVLLETAPEPQARAVAPHLATLRFTQSGTDDPRQESRDHALARRQRSQNAARLRHAIMALIDTIHNVITYHDVETAVDAVGAVPFATSVSERRAQLRENTQSVLNDYTTRGTFEVTAFGPGDAYRTESDAHKIDLFTVAHHSLLPDSLPGDILCGSVPQRLSTPVEKTLRIEGADVSSSPVIRVPGVYQRHHQQYPVSSGMRLSRAAALKRAQDGFVAVDYPRSSLSDSVLDTPRYYVPPDVLRGVREYAVQREVTLNHTYKALVENMLPAQQPVTDVSPRPRTGNRGGRRVTLFDSLRGGPPTDPLDESEESGQTSQKADGTRDRMPHLTFPSSRRMSVPVTPDSDEALAIPQGPITDRDHSPARVPSLNLVPAASFFQRRSSVPPSTGTPGVTMPATVNISAEEMGCDALEDQLFPRSAAQTWHMVLMFVWTVLLFPIYWIFCIIRFFVGIWRRRGETEHPARSAFTELRQASRDLWVLPEVRRLENVHDALENALQAFTHYVPKQVAHEALVEGKAATLGMRPTNCTIMMLSIESDIFSQQALSSASEEGSAALSALFAVLEACCKQITASHGTVDKCMNTTLLAFWNAPNPVRNYQEAAVRAALHCIEIIDRLNDGFSQQHRTPVRVFIGLTSGQVLFGNLGYDTGTRACYDNTVLGDRVNTCHRTMRLNSEYETRLLCDQLTAKTVSDVVLCRWVDTVVMKGKKYAEHVYEILGLRNSPSLPSGAVEYVKEYEACMALLQSWCFSQADQQIAKLERHWGKSFPRCNADVRILRQRLEGARKDVNHLETRVRQGQSTSDALHTIASTTENESPVTHTSNRPPLVRIMQTK